MSVLGTIVMLVGALFAAVSAIGLHRFDSVFARMHAAGKASTLGFGLVLAGAALRIGETGTSGKLALAGALALVTIPSAVHLIGRAAYRSGTELSPHTVLDELGRARRLRAAAAGDPDPSGG